MRYRFLRYPGGLPKAVTFSYDDAVRADIRLSQTCSRYGIKCTFNINTGMIAQQDGQFRLTEQEIRTHLLEAGHEIAVHGHDHRAPGALLPIDTIQDVLNCRLEMERRFGGIFRGMAYPDSGITRMNNGADYATIRASLAALDIAYARTLAGDNNSFALPTDWYAWMPTCHHANPNAIAWAKSFAEFDQTKAYTANRFPRLFYLWGHSYEFDNANNWHLLEKLCGILGNRQDVWYATNMEIHEYVTAYDRLVFSADGCTVYNPTLLTIWFDVDGKLYSIASGQTLRLGE